MNYLECKVARSVNIRSRGTAESQVCNVFHGVTAAVRRELGVSSQTRGSDSTRTGISHRFLESLPKLKSDSAASGLASRATHAAHKEYSAIYPLAVH